MAKFLVQIPGLSSVNFQNGELVINVTFFQLALFIHRLCREIVVPAVNTYDSSSCLPGSYSDNTLSTALSPSLHIIIFEANVFQVHTIHAQATYLVQIMLASEITREV